MLYEKTTFISFFYIYGTGSKLFTTDIYYLHKYSSVYSSGHESRGRIGRTNTDTGRLHAASRWNGTQC